MRHYRKDLAVAVYLDLCSKILGQILGVDSVLNLQTTFTKVLRISTATPTQYQISQPWQLHVVRDEIALEGAILGGVETAEDVLVAHIVD